MARYLCRVNAVVARWRLAAALLVLTGCGSSPTSPTVGVMLTPPPVLVGAGDIGVCGSEGTVATAALLDAVAGTIFTAGDNAYHHGSRVDFQNCYEPAWGRHKRRTRPSPGNHDYEQPGAAAYFAYFGDNAGPPGLGYYSFTVENWLVLSLNSNIPAGPGSLQLEWLRAELTLRPARCTVAIWHHPLASSGPNGGSPEMREVFRTLHEFNADVVINGHEHLYERFVPLNAQGIPGGPGGMRVFIVGTGGAQLSQTHFVKPGSEVRASVFGVLKLNLEPDAYEWEFISAADSSFRDAGRQPCR